MTQDNDDPFENANVDDVDMALMDRNQDPIFLSDLGTSEIDLPHIDGDELQRMLQSRESIQAGGNEIASPPVNLEEAAADPVGSHGPGPGGVEIRASGKEIQDNMTSDCHFLCGCANFDPLDKKTYESYGVEFFVEQSLKEQSSPQTKKSKGVRPYIPNLLSHAHQKAQEDKRNPLARFRIWKPVLEKGVKVKSASWHSTTFVDVTDNEGAVVEALESNSRTLQKRAEKKIQLMRQQGQQPEQTTAAVPGGKRQRSGANEESSTTTTTTTTTTAAPSVAVPLRSPINTVVSVGNSTVTSAIGVDLGDDPDGLSAKAKAIIKEKFVKRYDEDNYQDCLDLLYQDFNKHQDNGDYKEWAKQLYKILRENPEDPRCKKLNRARKTCLTLIYDMVNEWDNWVKEQGQPSQVFVNAMVDTFQYRRFKRILAVCLPMDRAQCLYLMRDLTNDGGPAGMPWYSSWHKRADTEYMQKHAAEQMIFQTYLENYQGYLGDGGSTMNKRLFRILFLKELRLQDETYFVELSVPAERPDDADVMLS